MLALLDYRYHVTAMYRAVRAANGDPAACTRFRQQRDELFRIHSQSALDDRQKAAFTSLRYYNYDPAYRVVAQVDDSTRREITHIDLGDDGGFTTLRFAQADFELPTGGGRLYIYWITNYGGGVFLPFGDATNTSTTYGGGRYLYDTIKGADLGVTETQIVLDFNYAYNPSCAYNPRWTCPLTPQENRLPFPIPAGERFSPV